MTSFKFLHVLKVITMFQVLLRDQWADAVVWPLVQKAGYQIQWVRTTWEGKKKTWGRVFSHFIAISYCNMWLVIWCGRTAAAFGWCKAPDSSQDPISVRVPSGSQRPSGQPQICVAHCASEVLIFIVFYCVVVLALMMLRYLGWGLIAVRHWLKLYYPQWQMLNVDVFTDLCKACHRPVHNVDAKRGRVHRPVHNQFAYAFGSAVVNPVKTLERLWFFS